MSLSSIPAGRLAGKIAVVTAAGQGIGRASAERLAAEGARVIATDINIDSLKGSGLDARRLDVRDNAQIVALAQEIGPIDILFNCAGFVHAGSILECSEADWDFAFDLNVKAMYRTMRAFLPGMLQKGSGSIIASPGETPHINPTGNPRLAIGGTGDVLAGILAARWQADLPAHAVASQAAWEHGALADQWPAQRALIASALAQAQLQSL